MRFIVRPRGVKDEYFHFYVEVLEDFNIHLPFTDFEFDLLKTINTAPSQLCPNSWGLKFRYANPRGRIQYHDTMIRILS